MKSYAVCRCVTAPQSLADKDGSCHWRIANRIIDTPRLKNSYMENFYCFEPESRIQSAESVTGSMHIVYRVPSNMVCQQQLSGIWQTLNSLKPFLLTSTTF